MCYADYVAQLQRALKKPSKQQHLASFGGAESRPAFLCVIILTEYQCRSGRWFAWNIGNAPYRRSLRGSVKMTVEIKSKSALRVALINKRTVNRMLGGVSSVALAFAMSSAHASDRTISAGEPTDGFGNIIVDTVHDNVNILGSTNANSVIFELGAGNGGNDESPIEIFGDAVLSNGIVIEADAPIEADDIFTSGGDVYSEATAIDDNSVYSEEVDNSGLIDSYAYANSTGGDDADAEAEATGIAQNSNHYGSGYTREEVDNHSLVNAKAQAIATDDGDPAEAYTFSQGIQQSAEGGGNWNAVTRVDNYQDGEIKSEADSMAVTGSYDDDDYANGEADSVAIEQYAANTYDAGNKLLEVEYSFWNSSTQAFEKSSKVVYENFFVSQPEPSAIARSLKIFPVPARETLHFRSTDWH